MQLGVLAQVDVGLGEDMVALLILDQVVEGDVGEVAGGRRSAEAGEATDRGAVGVALDPCGRRARGAERQESRRLAQDRPSGGVVEIGREGEVAIERTQLRATLIAGREQHVRVAEGLSVDRVELVVAIRAVHEAVVPADIQPVEVLAGDEVDHAGDGVGAIGRRGAVLQDLHPADGRSGEQVGVHAAAAGAGRGDHAPTIHQDQRPQAAKAAQIDRTGAHLALGRGGELVGVAEHRPADRQALDQVQSAGRTALLELLGADHVDGQGCVLGRAPDERTRDDDFLNFTRAWRRLGEGGAGGHTRERYTRQRYSDGGYAAEKSVFIVNFLP